MQWTRILSPAALAGIVLFGIGCGPPEETAELEMVVQVRTSAARIEDVEVVESAPATIFPKSQANVASKLTAPIARMVVGKGDRVSQGQALAWLSSGDLEAQVGEAEAQVVAARANLERVSAGTLPTEMERAQGEVERTQAALDEARQIHERRKILVEEGALPERDLLLAFTRFEQARSARRVAGTSLELLAGPSRKQDVRMAESALAQARARVELVRAQLVFARIDSPSAGVITEQFLYPGDMARPDAPLFTVMDLSAAVARAQFPEEQVGSLRIGQPCRFEGLDAPAEAHSGKLTVINEAIDPVRRTVEVWCEIPNRDRRLKAGAFGRVVVVVEVSHRAVTVPPAALHLDGESAIVWTVGSDGLTHRNRVRTGVRSADLVEVIDGLNGDETVVVEGGYGLSEGVAVHSPEPGE